MKDNASPRRNNETLHKEAKTSGKNDAPVRRRWRPGRDVKRAMLIGAIVGASWVGLKRGSTEAPQIPIKDAVAQSMAAYNQDTTKAWRLRPSQIHGDKAEKKALTRLLATLEQVPTGKDIVAGGRKDSVMLTLEHIPGLNGGYEPDSAHMMLNEKDTAAVGLQLATAAHELTHSGQFGTGKWENTGMSLKDRLLQHRVLEADAQARATQAAWELKERGDTSAWKAMEQNGFFGDVTKAYKTAAEKPRNTKNGKAMRAAFYQWFKDHGRMAKYDMYMLNQYYRGFQNETTKYGIKDFDGSRSFRETAETVGKWNRRNYLPDLAENLYGKDKDTRLTTMTSARSDAELNRTRRALETWKTARQTEQSAPLQTAARQARHAR